MLLDDVAVLEVFLNINLVGWIVMRFRTGIHVPQENNPSDFCDPLIFNFGQP